MKERQIGRHETSRGCIFLSSITGSRSACRSQWALIVRVEERCQEVTSRPKVCRCRFLKWGPVGVRGNQGPSRFKVSQEKWLEESGRPMPGGILDSEKEDRRKEERKRVSGTTSESGLGSKLARARLMWLFWLAETNDNLSTYVSLHPPCTLGISFHDSHGKYIVAVFVL